MSLGKASNTPDAPSKGFFFLRVIYAWVLLFAAIAVATAAYLGFWNPQPEQPGAWFSRSGSLITVLAIFAELIISKMMARMHGGIQKYVRQLVYPRAVAFALIIIGTVVWGYGDLLF